MLIENDINPEFSLIKSQIESDFDRTTVKMDYIEGGGYLQSEVSPEVTRYIVLNNGRLNKCTEVLAKDTILQNFVFNPKKEEIDIEPLSDFWDKYNKFQLHLAVKEKYQYGWGCCEITLDENGDYDTLEQFPAQTACIKEKEGKYYAVQRAIQGSDKYLRLYDRLDEYDSEDDDKLPICLWLGGGATHEFYDVPSWYPDVSLALAKINLNLLNAETFNNGNLIDGILTIITSPQSPDEHGQYMDDKIRNKVKEAGVGTLVMLLEAFDKDSPLKVDYTKISNDNWDYLEKFSESCDDIIMSNFSIPKTRLMIDDAKESMNSNKSDTMWGIYAISLNQEQYSIELVIDKFNKKLFGINAEVDIDTPVFSDKKQVELDNIIRLMDNGLITLGQTILTLINTMPEIDFTEIDLNASYMNERLYKGQIMGITDADHDDVADVMEWIKGVVQ